jgi:hypothetical protein
MKAGEYQSVARSGAFSTVVFWQLLPFAAAVLCATIAVPAVLMLAGLPGKNLPENDLPADYLAGLWYGLGLTLLVLVLPATVQERRVLLFLWLMRVIVVTGPMLFFEGHYTGGDSFTYYDAARSGFYYDVAAYGGHVVNFPTGTLLMQAVTTAMYNFGLHSFRAIKMTFAMIGFLGVYLFYRAAVLFLREHSPKLLLTLGLVPSILFWSSGIAKDPLIMFGVALYSLGAVGFCTRWNVLYLIPVALGLLIGSAVRAWMAPIMCCWLLAAGLTIRGHLATKVVVGVLALAAMIFLARSVLTSFSVKSQGELLEALQQNQRTFVGGGSKEEGVSVQGWGDALKFVPMGAFAAFFRPLPGEVMNFFGIMAGVEDVGFLTLFALALIRLRLRDFTDPVVAGTAGMLLVWAFFYAFVSSGNLGTAVRYRLQVLPLLIMLLLYLGRKKAHQASQQSPRLSLAAFYQTRT